jgi:hypothetical protein
VVRPLAATPVLVLALVVLVLVVRAEELAGLGLGGLAETSTIVA